ncbi:hypothetical protein [Butyrivibrio sp. MC2021]|uniref:hypothetical protein n=1 Tax=Butyrivibrio sp. MC2021 TaxID=1408306 RepID=UPI00047C3B11|nr:hypothetical protein [Butyrivibrio sp. MC2021]
MKIIQDIRIYRSDIENISGNSTPSDFYNPKMSAKLCAIFNRITMKLREKGFSMGDFHHLYINLTTCNVVGGMSLANRDIDKYHPWYRYYDVEVTDEFYDKLLTDDCILEAMEQGENMTMLFKEKAGSKYKARVYLRYLENGNYYPLIRIFDLDDNFVFEKNLPETSTLDMIGELLVGSKKVTIKPRKNYYAADLEPIIISCSE